MNQKRLEQDAQRFWRWFKEHRLNIEKAYNANPMNASEIIDCAMYDFFENNFKFEMGPGDDTDYYLAISPSGQKDRLVQTRRVVELAPLIREWEFLPARKARVWGYKMQLFGASGLSILDLSRWKYQLIGYNGKEFFDVTFFVPFADLEEFREDGLERAGYLAVDFELGEELAIDWVARVVISPMTSEARLLSFPNFGNHVNFLKRE